MDIYGYVTRLETVLRSRKDIEVEMLTIRWTGSGAKLRGEVRFCDNSRLSFFEMMQEVGKRKIRHTKYRFHYQDAGENLIFRYDNAPHHPHLSTFPDHKHMGNTVHRGRSSKGKGITRTVAEWSEGRTEWSGGREIPFPDQVRERKGGVGKVACPLTRGEKLIMNNIH
ncbi:MAG: hypothetical protein B6245_06145 [Desulfobacteraceae bacterium 4572_88]|nr:MAG: hypothetical protein B6245_06145 [Desulfobacteraceae bacterium 4572_88]